MIARKSSTLRVVLYEGRDSRPLPAELRLELTQTLLDRGFLVSSVKPNGALSKFQQPHILVLGAFEQAVSPLATDAQSNTQVHVRNVDGLALSAICELVDDVSKLADGEDADSSGNSSPADPKSPRWKPWFPVIDYDRCTNCMQCLSFCLFDVYGVTKAGQISVQNQSNCKTDCPACSRVCPEVAILFPKYKAGPINGDEISSDDVRREAMKVDISSLLGGDIYSMLRDRSAKAKSRFSKERDDDRALKERQRCLTKLQQNIEGLDIPAEVLSSLPSADSIRERAEKAKQKAQEALQMNAQNNNV
jgi:NAD-dependent dihydropyrimidine dehydrogenase PreA subunit